MQAASSRDPARAFVLVTYTLVHSHGALIPMNISWFTVKETMLAKIIANRMCIYALNAKDY